MKKGCRCGNKLILVLLILGFLLKGAFALAGNAIVSPELPPGTPDAVAGSVYIFGKIASTESEKLILDDGTVVHLNYKTTIKDGEGLGVNLHSDRIASWSRVHIEAHRERRGLMADIIQEVLWIE